MDGHENDVGDGKCKNVKGFQVGRDEKRDKHSIIAPADAVSNPRAVMIKVKYAGVA